MGQKKLFIVPARSLTSGLVLFALDSDTHRRCASNSAPRVDKRYLALVRPAPPISDAGLASSRRVPCAGPSREEVEAVTGYRVWRRPASEALLELTPHRRTHQIRLQLADLGSPIVSEPTTIRSAHHRSRPRLWLHSWQSVSAPATGETRVSGAPPPRGPGPGAGGEVTLGQRSLRDLIRWLAPLAARGASGFQGVAGLAS